MVSNSTCGIIILAAGGSSRLGQSKQLTHFGGQTLLHRTIHSALQTTPHVIVVLGADFETHRASAAGLPVHVVENHSWEKGMGSSLKTGLSTLRRLFPELSSVIIMVCDQPLLDDRHLRNLVEKQRQSKALIVASAYQQSAGVPALFTKDTFDALAGIGDEVGARKLLQQMKDHVVTVDFPEGAIDIDTPEDLERLRSKVSSK